MIAALLFCILPTDLAIEEHRDLVDVNYVYDYDEVNDRYTIRFIQIVWWDWQSWDQRYEVVDWRYLRSRSSRRDWPGMSPIEENGRYVSRFQDYSGNHNRVITAKVRRTLHTAWDPETTDRILLPVGMRSRLSADHDKRQRILSDIKVDD